MRLVMSLAAAVLLLAGCGSSDAGSSSATGSAGVADGAGDVTWGEGTYGVVLAHGAAFDARSWSEQAQAIADLGATVVAVEDTSPESIRAAVERLHDDGIADVALVGGSAGADSILELASSEPDLPDQLVLLSPNTVVDGLGSEPKLFVASEDEPVADVSSKLAAAAPGEDNVARLLPGSAHAQNIFDSDQGETALMLVLDRIRTYGTEES